MENIKQSKDVKLNGGALIGCTAGLDICPVCSKPTGSSRKKYCCDACRQKAFYHKFKSRTGTTYKLREKPRYKIGSRTKLVGGITETADEYIATISVGNDARQKSYSKSKLGKTGAKLAATFQRTAWIIELGVWSPEDGDPFAIMSYVESLKGNHEYEHAVIDRREVSSPYIPERDEDV